MSVDDYHSFVDLDSFEVAQLASAFGDHELAERARHLLGGVDRFDHGASLRHYHQELRRPNDMTYPHDDRRDNNRRDSNRNDPRDPRNDSRGHDPRDARGQDPRNDPRNSQRRDEPPPRDSNPPPDLLPEDDYRVKCVAHKWGWTSGNGEQLGVRLKIVEGPHAGRFITWYAYFTEKTEESTLRGMRALGFRGDDIRDCSSMYEQEAVAVVQHEDDQNGGKRARVRWINGADVMMKETMSDADLARFAAKLRGPLARVPTAARPATTTMNAGTANGNSRRDDRPPPRDQQRSFGDRNAKDEDNDIPF